MALNTHIYQLMSPNPLILNCCCNFNKQSCQEKQNRKKKISGFKKSPMYYGNTVQCSVLLNQGAKMPSWCKKPSPSEVQKLLEGRHHQCYFLGEKTNEHSDSLELIFSYIKTISYKYISISYRNRHFMGWRTEKTFLRWIYEVGYLGPHIYLCNSASLGLR